MEEYSVSRLAALIKRSIENNFSDVLLKAEVSALKQHSSGHLYFTLKDSDAVIDAICWKGVAQKQKITLKEGMEIKCTGQVSTYPMRSKYQFIVSNFELAGVGELLKILEELKQKLIKEGIFEQNKKKKIPLIPKLIGIITSPTGAVIQDILHRIRARFPRNILLWPVLVQGNDAAKQISEAIVGMNTLQEKQRPDVIIVARGGGGFEDLMPFNDEKLVRTIAASKIPIISAIGHETDTTLSDFAADLRAPTPTAAAEFVVPEKIKLQADISKIFAKLNMIMLNNIERKKIYLASNKILNINRLISDKIQKSDYCYDKMLSVFNQYILNKKISIAKILINKPIINENISELSIRLNSVFLNSFNNVKNSFFLLENSLETNSYVKTLRKGFVFVESEKSIPITSIKDAEKYSNFLLNFKDGKLKVIRKPSQVDLF